MSPKTASTWSERIQKLKEHLGSMEALAAKLGVNYMTVFRWSHGQHQPSRLAQHQIEELEQKVSR